VALVNQACHPLVTSRPVTPIRSVLTHDGGELTPLGGGKLVNPVLEALFGNRTAACVLLFLQCYGEGHAQRIAKTFGFGLNMTQRQLKRLEEQGVLVSRRLGNMRLFSFNERNPTVRNLRKFLEVELAALPENDQQHYFRQSQLPRQGNRPLVMQGMS
jgi:hypothetical protein